MATTGQLIRAARAACGLTQRKLASCLELPLTGLTISNWECDKVLPTDGDLVRIAEALRTTPENLQGDGVRAEAEPVRRGRPALEPARRKKNYRSPLSLNGVIPEWIGYADLCVLIRQYRGRMYDERQFKVWVEAGHPVFGRCPSRYDGLACGTAHPGVRRRVYNWPAVRAWLASTLVDPNPQAVNQ